jgi:hypothetical protein
MKVKGLLMLVGAALLIAGCQLTHPGSSSLAFIEIKGVPMERIRESVIQVFAEESYKVALPGRSWIVFTRDGTLNDRLQYGRYEESLTMRVEVSLGTYEDGVLVRLDAFALQGGEARGSVRVSKLVRRPYMRLLERVKEKAESTVSNEVKDQIQEKPSEVKQ